MKPNEKFLFKVSYTEDGVKGLLKVGGTNENKLLKKRLQTWEAKINSEANVIWQGKRI